MAKIAQTTQEKLEAAKAKWKAAKARAGGSKSSPAYFKELAACQVVLNLQAQLEREFEEKQNG